MATRGLSATRDQNPLIYPVLFITLLLSMGVFFLITPTLTGFVTATQTPDSIELFLDKTTFTEREAITGEIDITATGPVSEQTRLEGTIDGEQRSSTILAAFNASGISYKKSPSQMTVQGGSTTKTLVYSEQGQQTIFLRIPEQSMIEQVTLDIQGAAINGTYPKGLKMDIGMDGDTEWEYLGNLINYSGFIAPSTLNEQPSPSTTIVTDEEAYYCNLITLPRSKDFKIHASYASTPLAVSSGIARDMEVTLFSLNGVPCSLTSTSGCSVEGIGQADVCDLIEDPTSTTPQYYNCDLSISYNIGGNYTLSYAIEGDYFVCVDNAERRGPPQTDIYKLERDTSKGNGYKCGPLTTEGKTTCVHQITGDYFIKIQAAQYDGKLNKQVALAEGYTEKLFETELNNYLQNCPIQNNNCVIPIAVTSESKGLVHLDNLKIRYRQGGSISEENNLYEVSFTAGAIHEIDGIDLTQGTNETFTLTIDHLDMETPDVSNEKNETVEIRLNPGPKDQETILIQKGSVNITGSQIATEDLATFYKGLLKQLLTNHERLLKTLKYKQNIEQAVQQLTTYENQLSGSNGSTSQTSGIEQRIKNLVQSLPHYINVPQKVTTDLIISFNDITNDVVFANQQSETSKKQLYTLQQTVSITGQAEQYEVVNFDKTKELGTILKQTASSSYANSYLVNIIPSTLAATTSDITFDIQPEIVKTGNPLIVRWKLNQITQGVTLLFETNEINKLDQLKALIVPKEIPKELPQERASCGDGLCSVVEINGIKIPLEDQYTCPTDCKTYFPWAPIITLIALFFVFFYYFVYYKGPYNYHDLLNKMGKGKFHFKGKPKSKLFTTPKDEMNLKNYVQAALKRGTNKQIITKNLLTKGWTKQQTEAIFKSIKK